MRTDEEIELRDSDIEVIDGGALDDERWGLEDAVTLVRAHPGRRARLPVPALLLRLR